MRGKGEYWLRRNTLLKCPGLKSGLSSILNCPVGANMKIKEIRELVKRFSRTLDANCEKDEYDWWGSDRAIWNNLANQFLKWCEKNRKDIEKEVYSS